VTALASPGPRTRALLLARVRLAQVLPGAGWLPVAGILIHGGLIALVSLVLADALAPALFAALTLALSGLLCTTALLGDLAPLLAVDPAGDWVAAQPVSARDLERARAGVLVLVLGSLGLGGTLPASLFAPENWSLGQRLALPLLGGLQALALASVLTALLRAAGRSATEVAVGLQTLALLGLFAGVIGALSLLPQLRAVEAIGAPWSWLPPAALGTLAATAGGASGWVWIAAALALPWLPPAGEAPSRGTQTPLARLLSPLARLVEGRLLAPTQRAPFRFVEAALPAERDFAVRAWPLGFAPLALLAAGADPATEHGRGLYALACFAPAAYLPVFMTFVPTTATPAARWVLDAAPLRTRDEAIGARWAVFVRVVVPLQLAISGLLLAAVPSEQVLTWTLVSLALSGVVLAMAWSGTVEGPPLSREATELGGAFEGGSGGLLLNALLAGGVALTTWRLAPGIPAALGIAAVTLGALVQAGRRSAAQA
jgi:hypothetical protein